jgi:hypothetical protein
MANARCRGCVEPGWQGLRFGDGPERFHERTTAPGEREVISCVADMKKPKRVSTWRTCPNCGSKATKIMSANTGQFTCQICDHKYYEPGHEETDEEYQERTGEPRGAGRDWAGRVYPDDFADND